LPERHFSRMVRLQNSVDRWIEVKFDGSHGHNATLYLDPTTGQPIGIQG
jgi:hypothetical protein